jgi:hypothetical protein
MVKILGRGENKRGTGFRWLGGENLGLSLFLTGSLVGFQATV